MKEDPIERPGMSQRWPRFAVIGLCGYAIIGGLISFLGWALDIRRATDWIDSGILIQPNATIAVISAGCAVLLLRIGAKRAAGLLGAFVALIGASSIYQISTDTDLEGINTLLMFGREWGRTGAIAPGRMGTPGAISWTLIGAALILISFASGARSSEAKSWRLTAVVFALAATATSILSITGYLYGAQVLYDLPRLTLIALQTATFIFAVSLGIVMSVRDVGPMRILTEDSPAGVLARRVSPVLILLPILSGFCLLAGERADLYELEFGAAAWTLIEMVLLSILLWLTALSISRQARATSEQAIALRESEKRRKLAQEAGHVGIWDWNIPAGQTYWSENMWFIYGEKPRDINPDERFWSDHLHENDRERVKQNLRQVIASGRRTFLDEYRIVRADGSTRWIEARAEVSYDEDGTATRMYGVNLDVTERKESEERARLSDNQLRLVTNAIPALISYVDKDLHYRFVNEQYFHWFKIPVGEIAGKRPQEVFGEEAYNVLKPRIDEVLSGKRCDFETQLNYNGVGEKYVHISYIPDIGADGTVYGYYGLTLDLTDLKRSQDDLRVSEWRYRSLYESIDEGFCIIKVVFDETEKPADYVFLEVNPSFEKQTGIQNALGRSMREIDPEHEEHWFQFYGRVAVTGESGRFEYPAKALGRFFEGYAYRIGNPEERTVAILFNDITDRKRDAEELQLAHDQLEVRVEERTKELAETNIMLVGEMEEREIAEKHRLDLLRRLVSSQELERRRIARDLHDQMGQRLTALRLKIESLHDVTADREQLTTRVNRLQEIAERLDAEVSFLAWELRPSTLDDLGLVDAAGAFVNEWSKHYEIPADFHSNGLAKYRFDHETETHLYRITQEALNNVAKHAEANRVSVLLEKRDSNMILIIEDDGKGFDTNRRRASRDSTGGLGLIGMGERATLIGGEIEVESSPGKGTTIYVHVPFPDGN